MARKRSSNVTGAVGGDALQPTMFISAAALSTPAGAGIITMLITTMVGREFQLPANWTALAISFVIAGWVWGDTSMHWSRRAISHLLNAFVVFMIASGVNSSALAALHGAVPTPTPAIVEGEPRGVEPAGPESFLGAWEW